MNATQLPNHHPDQFMLLDYAAGNLPGAVALPLAVHLEFCPRCRAEAAQLHHVGAGLFEVLDPVPVRDDALARLFERIDDAAPRPAQGAVPATPPAAPGVPRALSGMLPQDWETLDWKRVTRSLRAATLRFGDPSHEISLQHIAAGGKVLPHDHAGTEITVVLRGRFGDEHGEYRSGDFLLRGPGDVHRPHADATMDCVCLAVLDAPIRLRGLFGRLANPFMRIHPA